jgi:hypothetical protein
MRVQQAVAVAIAAALAALAGTALADDPGATTSAPSKKKVRKIARKQADKRITARAPELSVASAETADVAAQANTAAQASSLAPPEGRRDIAANPMQSTDPCLAGRTAVFCGFFDASYTGWSDASGSGFGPGGFFRDRAGFVHLTGVVRRSGGAAPDRIVILPSGFRPGVAVALPVACWPSPSGTVHDCVLDVRPTGSVELSAETEATSLGLISLDGVSFRAR